jgi:kynureninase
MNPVERAKNLLIDDFFIELLEAQKETYKSYIFGSAEHDIEGREKALVKLRAIEDFEASIRSIAQNDEIEKKRFKVF